MKTLVLLPLLGLCLSVTVAQTDAPDVPVDAPADAFVDEIIEKKEALLLVTKDVDRSVLAYGELVPVKYNIYNVGKAAAINVNFREHWNESLGEVAFGSVEAKWPVVSPGERVTHAIVYVPKPSKEYWNETIDFFGRDSIIEYTCQETNTIHTMIAASVGQNYMQYPMFTQRHFDQKFGHGGFKIWMLFFLWVAFIWLFPYYVYYNRRKRYT